MSRASILALGVLVVAIGLFILIVARSNDPVLDAGNRADQFIGKETDRQQPVGDSEEAAATSERSIECIPMASIGHSPDAYRVDEWYMSWGAPPSFNLDISSRPYFHYQKSDIEELSDNGDSVAAHELGRSLVWSAFRGGERMPDYQTLWEIGGDIYPYDRRIDTEDLHRGREYLYRAAVEGRIYALIEISLSYAHQVGAARQNGDLDDKRVLEMQIEAYAYGEAVEILVVGMPASFFQATVPEGQNDLASMKLSDLTERFTQDRAAQGLDASTLPTVSGEMLSGLNLCIK